MILQKLNDKLISTQLRGLSHRIHRFLENSPNKKAIDSIHLLYNQMGGPRGNTSDINHHPNLKHSPRCPEGNHITVADE